ncbi:hypothetical protein TSUD_355230 [Trifolium subterraneum]|uniref:Uncharacterized protein n=1 Tax=Trifolium subterraneum TaxID=3900 RepID=A0A2Z6NLS0_TRISU|nr:hypothetical protein TSUD_355230 [Trifolium subterraneum]
MVIWISCAAEVAVAKAKGKNDGTDTFGLCATWYSQCYHFHIVLYCELYAANCPHT